MVSYSSDAAGTEVLAMCYLIIWEEGLPTGHLTNPGPLDTERTKHYDGSGILKTPIGLLRSHFTCLLRGGLRYKGSSRREQPADVLRPI